MNDVNGTNTDSVHGTAGEGTLQTTRPRPGSMMNIEMDRYGEPLLDFESLSSILVLLFIDDPNLSTIRLYRVIRNLCYHVPTRDWIISSLLTIIEKCNEKDTPDINLESSQSSAHRPQWLNIHLDAALGSRANTFILQKYFIPRFESKPKSDNSNSCSNSSSNSNISSSSSSTGSCDSKQNTTIVVKPNHMLLHWKASPIICRHVIELLIFLGKIFSIEFLPSKHLDKVENVKKKSDTSDNIMSCITSVIDSALLIPTETYDSSRPGPSSGPNNYNQ